MKDIFSDLFNKVFGFFRQSEQKEENAKDTAVNRLRVVLMQDRTNLTPELLEKMRGELIELLSKYVEMDKEALELNLEQDGDQVALMLSIPVIRAKDEEEIKAALEAEEKEKTSENEEEIESDEEETIEDEKDSDEVEIIEDEETSKEIDKEKEITESEEDKEDEKKD